MSNNVSPMVMCNAADCAMAAQCSRHQKYFEAQKTDKVLNVLNTALIEVSDSGCEHLHINKEVVAARGFRNIYGTVPLHAATGVWKGFPGNISRRQFYRILNGEVLLLPEDQTAILAYLHALGADTSLGFDIYETMVV